MRSTGRRSCEGKMEYNAAQQLPVRDRETGPSNYVKILKNLSRQSANALDFYSLKRYTLKRRLNEEGFQL